MNSFLYWMMKKETVPIQETKYEEEEEPLITLNSVILPIDNYDQHEPIIQDVPRMSSIKESIYVEDIDIEPDVIHQSDEKIEHFFKSVFKFFKKICCRCPLFTKNRY